MRSAIIMAALIVSRDQTIITGAEASFVAVCLLIALVMDVVDISK